jgi:hypothetical protein
MGTKLSFFPEKIAQVLVQWIPHFQVKPNRPVVLPYSLMQELLMFSLDFNT